MDVFSFAQKLVLLGIAAGIVSLLWPRLEKPTRYPLFFLILSTGMLCTGLYLHLK